MDDQQSNQLISGWIFTFPGNSPRNENRGKLGAAKRRASSTGGGFGFGGPFSAMTPAEKSVGQAALATFVDDSIADINSDCAGRETQAREINGLQGSDPIHG